MGEIVRSEHFFDSVHADGAMIIDEDRLLDHMEEVLADGGCVVEHHSCDFFPERWFDLVVVLLCNNTLLFDRLSARGYPLSKVQENVECEIMQVVLQEAQESYRSDVVMVLESESAEQLQQNARAIVARAKACKMA